MQTISNKGELRIMQNLLKRRFKESSERIIVKGVGTPAKLHHIPIYWVERLSLWAGFDDDAHSTRYWNAFGLCDEKPERHSTLSPIAEINPPKEGIKNTGGVFAKDSSGNIFVLHRGNFHNLSLAWFQEHYKGEWASIMDGNRNKRMAFIGSLNDPTLIDNIDKFVHEVKRLKVQQEQGKTL